MNESAYGGMSENTDALIDEIRCLFLHTANRHAVQIDQETQYLLQTCTNPNTEAVIKNLTAISFHILDAIGRYGPISSIQIAQKTGVPKGTVSKNTKKLMAKNLMIKTYLPNNNKESVFNLTALGEEIFELHAKMHRRLDDNMAAFFKKYSNQDLQFLAQFLKDYEKALSVF